MSYKLLYIVILNVLLSQSFFNNVTGNQIGFQSARSMAIGNTHFMNSTTSVMALRNPAKLGELNLKNNNLLSFGLKLDYSLLGSMYSERRSIDLKDFFGGFLTEGDYVSNNNFNSYHHFGLMANIKLLSMNLGLALSHGPWSTLDYYYKEEIRGMEPSSQLVRDPIRGYHIMEHEGTIDLTSLGFGFGINKLISVGASINYIHDGNYKYFLDVTQVGSSSQHLASVSSLNHDGEFKGDVFPSASLILNPKNIEISIGYEKSAIVKDSDNFSISSSTGLPFYIYPQSSDEQVQFDPSDDISNFINENFTLKHIDYIYIEKPERMKLGINYKIGANKYSRLVSFEIIKNIFSNSFFQDCHEFNLGIEHVKYDKIFRAGLSYKESSLKTSYLSPLTTFSFGTSKKINKLIFDIAASYSYQRYQYHDLFPVSGDSRPDFDSVHESNWTLISTLSYQF